MTAAEWEWDCEMGRAVGIAVGSVFPSAEEEMMTAAVVVVGFASLTEAEEAEGVAVALLPGWLTHGGRL